MTTTLQIGDVIEANSSWYVRGGVGYIDGTSAISVAQHFKENAKRPSPAPRHQKKVTTEAKGSKRYVVTYSGVETDVSGGSREEGWYVVAKQLNKDGTYNPDGQKITFSQSDFARYRDFVGNTRVVGKMEATFAPKKRAAKNPQP